LRLLFFPWVMARGISFVEFRQLYLFWADVQGTAG
jgi:hypothetical protein